MSETNDTNMTLWDSVCETDPNHTRRVEQRGGFTAIDAQYQRLTATQIWGVYGTKWGLKELHYGYIKCEEAIVEMYLDATFWAPDIEFPISCDMVYRPGNDSRKKLATDATTKALSYLGFNADVFLGLFDDNKYIESLQKKDAQKDKKEPPTIAALGKVLTNAKTAGKAIEILTYWTNACQANKTDQTIADEGKRMINETINILSAEIIDRAYTEIKACESISDIQNVIKKYSTSPGFQKIENLGEQASLAIQARQDEALGMRVDDQQPIPGQQ